MLFRSVAIVARALAGVGFSPLDNVVVAVNHVQPAGLIEFGQQLKGVGVGLNDGLLISIFPQLVSISQFDIGVAVGQIVLERAAVDLLVGQNRIQAGNNRARDLPPPGGQFEQTGQYHAWHGPRSRPA